MTDDGAPDVRSLNIEQRVARKEHACDLCRQPIKPGDVYYRQTWIEDGVFRSMKVHDRQGNCGMYAVLANWPL